jgi:hypothetical protein
MTLLTENPVPPSWSVSLEDGGTYGGVAVLEIPRQDMRFCEVCECEQIFVAAWECEFGLLGCCLGCGAEQLVPYSRVNSGVE